MEAVISNFPHEQDNAAQIAFWNDKAAVVWTTLQDRLDKLFEPLTNRALDAAAPAVDEHVIDVGCGCGATVLALAKCVGPAGHVLGVDVSIPMAARAAERIAHLGLSNAHVVLSDASTYSFAQASADLLFSRFGIMFFADPLTAFANLHRAMRPGGRMLCAAWRPLAENPWFSVPLDAARDLMQLPPTANPDAPGPFALANPDQTRQLLSEAGWQHVQLMRHDAPMRFAETGEIEQATDFATQVGPLARALADETPEIRARVKDSVAEKLIRYDSPAGIALTGSVWLISARA